MTTHPRGKMLSTAQEGAWRRNTVDGLMSVFAFLSHLVEEMVLENRGLTFASTREAASSCEYVFECEVCEDVSLHV